MLWQSRLLNIEQRLCHDCRNHVVLLQKMSSAAVALPLFMRGAGEVGLDIPEVRILEFESFCEMLKLRDVNGNLI